MVAEGKGGDESNEGVGTPQEEVYKDEKVLLHLTWMERDDK